MKNVFLILLVVSGIYFGFGQTPGESPIKEVSTSETFGSSQSESLPAVVRFNQQDAGRQFQGEGVVTRILSDDNDDGRHQRFILSLTSGQTILIAHNIDLAPRISAIRVGDSVEFNGEYEWNDLGGVVHWTHHDPVGRHVAGWLKHGGRTFQ
ncbi:MAG: DUF3465 domain-containing protein [Gammaproteobacteria bacterium]|nr:DUF3465 domain-containing protein [Gammaproteobacteria bacterium]